MMQITDLEKEQQIPAFFRLGFRPFFIMGALFSTISILLWLLMLQGKISFVPMGGGYWWHIHEMIFGFGSAIIAGFLLTAIQNWTGIPGIRGKILIYLVSLWLIGRFAIAFPNILGSALSTVIDLMFLPCVAWVLAKPILAIKQYRNLFFVPLLLFFTLANIEMHLAITLPETFNFKYTGYTGVLLTCFLISVMAGRVVPMFTANGTGTTKVLPLAALEKLTNGSLLLSTLLLLLEPLIGFEPTIFGGILMLSGVFQMMRWLRWKPWITLSVPLLWSLHGSIKYLSAGLILVGISYIIPELPSNHLWHLLTIGGMGGIILAMISRVSLGHTGRILTPPKTMNIAFILILLSALIRSIAPIISPAETLWWIELSGWGWIIAFSIFVINYAPMLATPRIDGRPG